MRREESRHDFAFFAGVIIGAIAGAVAALALAPRVRGSTGEHLRQRVPQVDVERIRERARAASETVKETAASRAAELRERAASGEGPGAIIGTARERAAEVVNRSPLPVEVEEEKPGEELKEAAADTAQEAEEAARDKLETAGEKGQSAAEAVETKAEDAADEARDRAQQAGE